MRAVRYLALAALFATAAVPALVTPPLLFPFVTGKALWFRGCVDVAVAALAILQLWDQRLRVPWSRVLGTLLVVLLAIGIADWQAPYPRYAFFSRPERMDGYIELVHFAGFLVACAFLLDSEKRRRAYLWALVGSSIWVGIEGLVQEIYMWVLGIGWEQIGSTLGNPVFLGQYAAMMVCIAAFLWPKAGRRGRMVLAASGILDLAMIFLSQGRGAALALIAAGLVAAFAAGGRRAGLAVLLATGAAALLLVAVPTAMVLADIPREHHFLDVSLSDPRFETWRIAVAAARMKPFLGWGQEGMLLAGGFPYHIDRAHNLVLDWLVAGGVLGLWAWVFFLAAIRREIALGFAGGERAALYACLAAYLVSDMFLFDTVSSYLLLAAVAGVAVARQAADATVHVRAQPASTEDRELEAAVRFGIVASREAAYKGGFTRMPG